MNTTTIATPTIKVPPIKVFIKEKCKKNPKLYKFMHIQNFQTRFVTFFVITEKLMLVWIGGGGSRGGSAWKRRRSKFWVGGLDRG
jgi:hypothetical protein